MRPMTTDEASDVDPTDVVQQDDAVAAEDGAPLEAKEPPFSPLERVVLWGLLGAFVVVGLAYAVAPEAVWDDRLAPVVWDPIVLDASDDAGDAGYNRWNTALYTAGLFVSVLALQALFRHWRLPSDDLMVLTLAVWVCLAPVLRVLEDAHIFPPGNDVLFISPIIHFHLAAWLVAVGLAGYRLDVTMARSMHPSTTERRVHHALLFGVPFGLLGFWSWVLRPAHDGAVDIGSTAPVLFSLLALVAVVLCLMRTTGAPAVTRALLSFGVGAVFLSMGYYVALAQQLSVLYVDDPHNNIVLWPLFVVVGLPLLIAAVLHRYGAPAHNHLTAAGHVPGVLPEGVRLEVWEADPEAVASHPVERLSTRAMLASPLVLLMLIGQLADGFATFLGLDVFGYAEKHVASQGVIELGATVNEALGIDFGVGAWLFMVVKAVLVTLIVMLFARMRVEHRQQHLRVLIVLAVMIVGLAPGLRDVGRLILDV
jgi:uncharacterized membrane protein